MKIEEHVAALNKLVAENEAEETRTPFLDVMRGALRTALEQAGSHVAALEAQVGKQAPAAKQ